MATLTRPTPATPETEHQSELPDMAAVTQDRYGDASVLRFGRTVRPTPGPDQVLIRVQAAGLDRGTEHLMTGRPWLIRLAGFGFLRPKQPVPGLDVAGTVVAVGRDVTRFAIGDEVFGIGSGTFAEFALAAQDKLALKPSSISFDQAAVSAVSSITALQALTDVGRVIPGQRVLVIGASGGVGSFAVQLASALGATVDGVAGTQNLEVVSRLGARTVYDHRTADLDDIDERYDLVLDIGGRNPLRKLRRRLTKSGTLVIVGGEDGNRVTGGIGRQLRAVALSPFVSQRLTMFMSSEHHSHIERLADFLALGDVAPAIGTRVPLARAAEAVAQLGSGTVGGKTAIVVVEANASEGAAS